MTIYPATLADLDALCDVLALAFHPPQGFQSLFFYFYKLSIGADLQQRLGSRERHYCCLAAWVDGELVGTLEISLRRLPAIRVWRPEVYISNVAVLPQWRRRGVARRLLQGAEGIVKAWGYSTLYLHVEETNAAARSLYTSLNYEIVHVTPNLWFWLGCPRQFLLGKWLR